MKQDVIPALLNHIPNSLSKHIPSIMSAVVNTSSMRFKLSCMSMAIRVCGMTMKNSMRNAGSRKRQRVRKFGFSSSGQRPITFIVQRVTPTDSSKPVVV